MSLLTGLVLEVKPLERTVHRIFQRKDLKIVMIYSEILVIVYKLESLVDKFNIFDAFTFFKL